QHIELKLRFHYQMSLPWIDRKFDRNACFFEHYVKLLGLGDWDSIILLTVLDQSGSFHISREKHRGAFFIGLQIAPRLASEISFQRDRYVSLSVEAMNVRNASADRSGLESVGL